MPGNGAIMFPIDAKSILDYIIPGVIGWLLLSALFWSPAKPKTEVDHYLDEINHLKKKNKHLFGLHRYLENANVTLNWELQISQKRNNQSQLDQERLNVELVRRENQIRSMSIERSQERKVVMGRR
jgi:hypothetical protein